MTQEEIEGKARQETKNYKTVYSEDFRFDEVMKDPLRFEQDYSKRLYLILKEKHYRDGFADGAKWGFEECRKTVDLELIHIINDIVKYRDDEETRKDEYETAVWKLARYWEKLGKIELAEWTLAQIGVNAWTPQ